MRGDTERRLPCQVHDADLWFGERQTDVDDAKRLCRTCPLRAACLREALGRQETWGVWGGELLENGVVIPRKPRRGRPPKTPLVA